MNTINENKKARSSEILALINALDYEQRRDFFLELIQQHGNLIIELLPELLDKVQEAHPEIDNAKGAIATKLEMKGNGSRFTGYYRSGSEG